MRSNFITVLLHYVSGRVERIQLPATTTLRALEAMRPDGLRHVSCI